jgi:ribosome-associated heat shock protein Hsp15
MPDERVRIDVWLWAARFAKTRALANEAAGGGRVKINGATVKPSRDVDVGDVVEVVTGPVRRTVVVKQVVRRRVSAAVAATLFEETPESIAAREEAAAVRKLAEPLRFDGKGRPTKRDRRRFESERQARRAKELE